MLDRGIDARVQELTDALCEKIRDARLPLLSIGGAPVIARGDLRRETEKFIRETAAAGTARPVQLQASVTLVGLAYGQALGSVDLGQHHCLRFVVGRPQEIWRHGLNDDLDMVESHALLNANRPHCTVRAFAQGRNMLHSTVNAYVHPGERVVGFGAGGSESMTIFFRTEGEQQLMVRKVLSEDLTTARWDAEGTGPMLPPFTKAKRQAEYLAAVPASLVERMPRVRNVVERELVSRRADGTKRLNRELVYEMTFVDGLEVGEYVRRHVPPTAVVARLYEQIVGFLHHEVHTHRRQVSPGDTLEEQYFTKIEDRLRLSRETAPLTFSPDLLDTDEIVINGRRYRNHRRLLEAFRSNRKFLTILEPRMHALVIGDTNTENIKIGNAAPLLEAEMLIRSGATDAKVRDALNAITPNSVDLKFLDPRAIGFHTEGARTVDDPMYDNKPWHNSIGHYDEIHNEYFELRLDTSTGRTPKVDIAFSEGNPYQRAYQVRDAVVNGTPVNPASPVGMEDYFAAVMSAVYDGDERTRAKHREDDPHWISRFVFTMGTHFTAMPPFHFSSEIDGSVIDSPEKQRRPIAIYCEGIKWLNWALEMLEGTRSEFLGVPVNHTIES